jgi:3-methyl-2-oxobutanoate hydroxymethyltransferase
MKRNTISSIRSLKGVRPIVCLTAYTAPVARILDDHTDLILVGDSLGMVLYNMSSTLPVTVDMMIAHGKAVSSSSSKALIVVDMPFGSYQASKEQAFENAARIMKETNCSAIKLEGGTELSETVEFLTKRGNSIGGYRVMGKDASEAQKIIDDAKSMQNAGAFAVVLECVTPDLSETITKELFIPTIGIGASQACDGQILVTEDMIGMGSGRVPKFVKQYSDINTQINDAVVAYSNEVKARSFPSDEFMYDTGQVYNLKKVNK